MIRWRRNQTERITRCGIFDLLRVGYTPSDGRAEQKFYVIDGPDWINVIPITPDRQVLFIRQFRFGIEDDTLEIPGGMCDPGETPLDAAARELVEETGYAATDLTQLGWVHPNPAIQSNRCYTFLAEGLEKTAEPKPDPNESFEQLRLPLADIPRLIKEGRITHALVVAAFGLLPDDEFTR
jgi:ADP-ribose pyrophosphatase